jgi:hypothetical protein
MTEFDSTEPSFYSDKLVPELLKEIKKLTKQVKLGDQRLQEKDKSYNSLYLSYSETELLLRKEKQSSKFWKRISFGLGALLIGFLILGSI